MKIKNEVDSWYQLSKNKTLNFPELKGEMDFDACVVGGGTTGLSAALNLRRAGFKTAVVEAKQIGWGASGRNGGHMIAGYGCDHTKLLQLVGAGDAKKLWDLSVDAVKYTRKLVADYNITCDLTMGHIHAGLNKRHVKELEESVKELRRDFGCESLRFLNQQEIRNAVHTSEYLCGYRDSESGHLHPLNFTIGLADAAVDSGVEIFENSEVVRIDTNTPHVIETTAGKITCRYAVIAGNAYLRGIAPALVKRVMPVGTYMVATERLEQALIEDTIPNNEAVCDIKFVLDYYRRSADRRMLYGGRVSYSGIDPLSIKSSIRERMVTIFPQLKQAKIEYAWGGYVAITINRFPHFGRLAKDVYFAQGFSGHGVALTNLAGKLIAESVAKTSSDFDVFEKVRHMPFPGGAWFRKPALVLAMLYYRLRDYL